MITSRIAILIPSYQPDIKLLLLCKQLFDHGVKDVLIVNDGSDKDYTSIFESIQEKYKYPILTHPVNMGKGRSLKDGIKQLLEQGYDGCITADADGQHRYEDILTCYRKLQEEPDKFIIGVRDFDTGNIPLADLLWNKVTKVIFRYLYGKRLSDSLCGLRGMTRRFMEEILDIEGEHYEYETRVLIKATQEIEIVEFPIATIYDQKGHFTSRDSFEIYKIFAKVFLTFAFSSLSATVIDLFLFHILCNIFEVAFPLAYVAIATAIARAVSATYNYIINKKVVFRGQKKHKNSTLKYFILAVSQTILSALAVTGLVHLFKGVSETFLKMIVDLFLFFTSYPIQQKYVFADRESKD